MLKFFYPTILLSAALCGLAMLSIPRSAEAHSFNESYVYFIVSDERLSGRIEVSTSDLARAFGSAEETISEDEVLTRQDEFFEYFRGRLLLSSDEQSYPIQFDDTTFLSTDFGNFAQFNFSVPGLAPTPEAIQISYDFLYTDIDETHRGYALIESNTRTGVANNESYISLFFEPGDGRQTLSLIAEPAGRVALEFFEHGVWHIWLGFDHVLFLITLLISSVMVISGRKWVPTENLRESLRQALVIVTVFTVAHTITLGLATFDIIRLPVFLVEAVIALSIAAVALGNLVPRLHTTSWIVVFVFGLFHGFGFANVLAPLGLDPARKAIGLATFNIGVEAGQLAIVLLVFPMFFLVRRLAAYRVVFMQLGSIFLIAIALFWFVERTYDVLGPVRATLLAMFN